MKSYVYHSDYSVVLSEAKDPYPVLCRRGLGKGILAKP